MVDINITEKSKMIIIELTGNFFSTSVFRINNIWNSQFEKSPEVIVFDFTNLDLIDSAAIGTLVQFYKISKNSEIHLFFYNLKEAIHDLFKTARLDDFFKIIDEKKIEELYKKY